MTEQVQIKWIQSILDGALTSLGWQHETDEDGTIGGEQEYGLGCSAALRLRRYPVFLWGNGHMSFRPSPEEGGKPESTEIQSKISPALEWLGFELVKTDKMGGDQKYTLPGAKATKLRRHNIVVRSDGSLGFAE